MTSRTQTAALFASSLFLCAGLAHAEPEKTPAAPATTPAAKPETKPDTKPAAAKPAATTPEVKIGDTLPALSLKSSDGKDIDLKSLYSKQPIVLTFYRGGWCPFCVTSLKSFQDKMQEATALGATIVAVSPESPEELSKTSAKANLAYTLLSDSNGSAINALGLAFSLDERTQSKYKGYGVDLSKRNADGKWELPHPATLVIDTKGVVRYAYVNADYTKRATPDDVLTAVKKLQAESKPTETKPTGGK